MLRDEDLFSVLTEDLKDEILSRMPKWFKVLRKAYLGKLKRNSP